MTTPLGDPVFLAAAVALPVLVIRSMRRKRINTQLQDTLRQARQLQDQDKRQQVFFDAARRYARNNGSRVDLECRPGHTAKARSLGAPTPICSVTTVGPHNLHFSIQSKILRKWKIWAAVDAEFDLSASREPPSPARGPAGADLKDDDGEELTPAVRVSREPLTWAVAHLMKIELAEFARWMYEQDDGIREAALPQEVDLEILFWDTVVSLEFDTREMVIRTKWVGKVGERRPSQYEWTIIPIPFFFDI